MHIEPGVVEGTKLVLSYATATVSLGLTAKIMRDSWRQEGGAVLLLVRSLLATLSVICFFEIFPHYSVGVSEVHFIMATSLFLFLGAGPTAFGLVAGLAFQGFVFAPIDLAQYGMNITTLVMPLVALMMISNRVMPKGVAYTDLTYRQVLTLSVIYQSSVVSWVAFWVFYGQGFTASNMVAVGGFATAYLVVIVVEPLFDLLALALAKTFRSKVFLQTLYRAT